MGYSPQQIAAAPEVAELGLGCGNPQAIASAKMRNDPDLQCSGIGGAACKEELRCLLQGTGFEEIRIDLRKESRKLTIIWAPAQKAEAVVVSASSEAVNPAR